MQWIERTPLIRIFSFELSDCPNTTTENELLAHRLDLAQVRCLHKASPAFSRINRLVIIAVLSKPMHKSFAEQFSCLVLDMRQRSTWGLYYLTFK